MIRSVIERFSFFSFFIYNYVRMEMSLCYKIVVYVKHLEIDGIIGTRTWFDGCFGEFLLKKNLN